MYSNIVSAKIKRNILQEEKENVLLTESGIRMPAGTKSAKIVFHADGDGIFSAILTRAQLEKQGIPKNRISFEIAQYGDPEDELYNKSLGKKGQMVSVVDFAAFPTGNAFSDLNGLFNYKMDKEKFLKFIHNNEEAFKTMSIKEFEEKISSELGLDIAKLDEKKKKSLHNAYRAFKHFDFSKAAKLNAGNIEAAFEDSKLNKADFTSDHHDNAKGNLTPGKSGKIGATGFGSDAEHIATVYAQNLADYSSIKEITTVDAARYSDLENTILLSKDFRSKGRMEKLATILNTLIPQVIKKNPALAKEIARDSSPSIVSVYNNTLKASKLNDKQLAIYAEMKNENPDWNKIQSLVKELPSRLQKGAFDKDKYKSIVPLMNVDQWREKNKKDVEKAKTGYFSPKNKEELEILKNSDTPEQAKLKKEIKELEKEIDKLSGVGKKHLGAEVEDKIGKLGALVLDKKAEIVRLDAAMSQKEKDEKIAKITELENAQKTKLGKFQKVGNVMRQDAANPKDYPSRYMSSLLEKDGMKSPFVLKRFGTMIQVAVNPYAAEQVKGVDLGKLANQILDELQADFKQRKIYNDWAMKIVKKESGGHKQITNISGLGTIGLMPSPDRARYNELNDIKKRVVAVGKKFDKMMPKKKEELDKLQSKKDEAAKLREESMNYIEKRFYELLWKNYHAVKVPGDGTGKYEISK
mgnify:CR=1 FL=1